jgi:hypothetical protein
MICTCLSCGSSQLGQAKRNCSPNMTSFNVVCGFHFERTVQQM